jgi:hypothetical protein
LHKNVKGKKDLGKKFAGVLLLIQAVIGPVVNGKKV